MQESTRHVMERVRTEIREHHSRVEALPFFKALQTATLPLESYVGLLRSMGTVLGVLEQVAGSSHPSSSTATWSSYGSPLAVVRKDLAQFESGAFPDVPDAILRALVLVEHIQRRGEEASVSLIGYLVVFEDAMLGSVLRPAVLERCFGANVAGGTQYLASYEAVKTDQGEHLAQRLHRIEIAEHEGIVEATREALEGVEGIIQALFPIAPDQLRELVSRLNPEAGNHIIPDDPAEIQAALRAGRRSWRQFPYYELRYGERGKRFTRSDSAWLVTLAAHRQDVVDHQIAWLGRLLAARGMPQWLLERHLEVLHEELVRAVPEKRSRYDKLLAAAERLHETRRAHIGDEAFDALPAAFDAMVGEELSARLPEAGRLLVQPTGNTCRFRRLTDVRCVAT
jgi:hypothetical protein